MLLNKKLLAALLFASGVGSVGVTWADSIDTVVDGKQASAAADFPNIVDLKAQADYMAQAQKKQESEMRNQQTKMAKALERETPTMLEFRSIKGVRWEAKLRLFNGKIVSATNLNPYAAQWKVTAVHGNTVDVMFAGEKATFATLEATLPPETATISASSSIAGAPASMLPQAAILPPMPPMPPMPRGI